MGEADTGSDQSVTCTMTEGRSHLGWEKLEQVASDRLQGEGRATWEELGSLSEKPQLKKQKVS